MKKFLRVILYIALSILALWVMYMRWFNIDGVSSLWEGYNFGYIFLGLNGAVFYNMRFAAEALMCIVLIVLIPNVTRIKSMKVLQRVLIVMAAVAVLAWGLADPAQKLYEKHKAEQLCSMLDGYGLLKQDKTFSMADVAAAKDRISPDDFETMNAMFSYLLYWNIDLLKSHCTDCPEHSYPRYFIDGTPNRGG